MPTSRPRYQVTETEEVARALEVASRRWPGETRSRLLIRLVGAGADTISGAERHVVEDRRAAILGMGDRFAGAFGEDYLDELRADWPE